MSARTLAPFGRRAVPVLAVEELGAYVLLRCADPGGPADPHPGQFYMLAARERWGAGESERPFLPRAFSYLRAGRGELSFLLEDVGPGTHRLAQLRAGEELWLLGPLGTGFAEPADGRRALLVGGGIGIVPLAAWQRRLRAAGVAAAALVGFRDAAHARAAELLDEPLVVTEDGSVGAAGLVTAPLAEALDAEAHAVVYACGPPGMLEAVRALCQEREVPGQLALEAGMACGYGACFGCAVPTRSGYVRICLDGPVIAAAELETALIPGTGH